MKSEDEIRQQLKEKRQHRRRAMSNGDEIFAASLMEDIRILEWVLDNE